MRVLVTGGYGFVGSHLVRSLLADSNKIEVVVLDSLFRGQPSGLAGVSGECSFMQHTVCNYDAVLRAMRGVHVVYHLAARMDASNAPQHPAKVFNTNTHGTAEVLTAARASGVQKVIFTSSAAVYGDVVPSSEKDMCAPVSVYGASKLAAEAVCRGFIALGLEVVVLRLFNVYGEGGHSVADAFRNGTSVVFGDGEQTRDFVHVSDVVRALRGAYYWEPGVYNIGTGVETRIIDVWHTLHNSVEPTFALAQQQEVFRSCADTDKTKSMWQAKRTLKEELK